MSAFEEAVIEAAVDYKRCIDEATEVAKLPLEERGEEQFRQATDREWTAFHHLMAVVEDLVQQRERE